MELGLACEQNLELKVEHEQTLKVELELEHRTLE